MIAEARALWFGFMHDSYKGRFPCLVGRGLRFLPRAGKPSKQLPGNLVSVAVGGQFCVSPSSEIHPSSPLLTCDPCPLLHSSQLPQSPSSHDSCVGPQTEAHPGIRSADLGDARSLWPAFPGDRCHFPSPSQTVSRICAGNLCRTLWKRWLGSLRCR